MTNCWLLYLQNWQPGSAPSHRQAAEDKPPLTALAQKQSGAVTRLPLIYSPIHSFTRLHAECSTLTAKGLPEPLHSPGAVLTANIKSFLPAGHGVYWTGQMSLYPVIHSCALLTTRYHGHWHAKIRVWCGADRGKGTGSQASGTSDCNLGDTHRNK